MNFSMCLCYHCEKRVSCYRYRAIPVGNKQRYMIDKTVINDECQNYIEIDENSFVNPEE